MNRFDEDFPSLEADLKEQRKLGYGFIPSKELLQKTCLDKVRVREAIFRNKTRFGSDFSCGEDAEEKRISETIEEFCDTLIQELNL